LTEFNFPPNAFFSASKSFFLVFLPGGFGFGFNLSVMSSFGNPIRLSLSFFFKLSGFGGKSDNFSMKISKKSELVELLKIFQNQINTIRTTIDKLIKTTIASEKEIFELNKPPKNSSKTSQEQIKKSITNGFNDLLAPPEKLSDLPPKPDSLKMKDSDNLIGLPKLDITDKLKPKPKPKPLSKKTKKKDLLAEKKALGGKLNSVKNLIDFIEKKYASKQIDKKSYEKRVSQLKNDLKTTQNKIEEIDRQL